MLSVVAKASDAERVSVHREDTRGCSSRSTIMSSFESL